MLVAGKDGNRIGVNSYDEYGIPPTDGAGNTLNTGRFQYTGQIWLQRLGMYYYKARMYSPTIGRFMQTDPIGYEDDSNLYAYVGNDPVNGVDPTGMNCVKIINEDGSSVESCDPPPPPPSPALSSAKVGDDKRRAPPKPQSNLACGTPPINSAENQASAAGNRDAYWSSRLDRCDPFAETALNIVRNDGLMAGTANLKLRSAIAAHYPTWSGQRIVNEMNAIGVDLMRAHTAMVNSGNISDFQAATYHHDVFSDHGLPPGTFGGTTVFGSPYEVYVYGLIWSDC